MSLVLEVEKAPDEIIEEDPYKAILDSVAEQKEYKDYADFRDRVSRKMGYSDWASLRDKLVRRQKLKKIKPKRVYVSYVDKWFARVKARCGSGDKGKAHYMEVLRYRKSLDKLGAATA